MNECYLCHKTYDLFQLLHVFGDPDEGEIIDVHLCGKCWNVIAAVAVKVMEPRLIMIENKDNNDRLINVGKTDEEDIRRLREMGLL